MGTACLYARHTSLTAQRPYCLPECLISYVLLATYDVCPFSLQGDQSGSSFPETSPHGEAQQVRQGVRGKFRTDDARLPVHSIESSYCGCIRPRARVAWVLFGQTALSRSLCACLSLSLSDATVSVPRLPTCPTDNGPLPDELDETFVNGVIQESELSPSASDAPVSQRDGDEHACVVRFLHDDKECGKIIGKAGGRIKEIRAISNASVQLTKGTSLYPGTKCT